MTADYPTSQHRPPIKKASPTSAVRAAAEILREEIFQREPGALLGSEDELHRWLGVSRPTFRQAARLLEHEQLLIIKRGVGGGYFAGRPDISAVVAAAAAYLREKKTTMHQLVTAAAPLEQQMARLAARSKDRTLRAQLSGLLVNAPEAHDRRTEVASYLKWDAELSRLIAAMTENQPIMLCLNMLYQFGLSQRRVRLFHDKTSRLPLWLKTRLALAEAILAGDEDEAAKRARACTEEITEWLNEDLTELDRDRPLAEVTL